MYQFTYHRPKSLDEVKKILSDNEEAKLLAGGRITPHTDTHPSFHRGHRIHVPITTNPRVRFMIDGRPHQLQVGRAYEINNQMNHSVMNSGSEDRITFIFDYMPSESLKP